ARDDVEGGQRGQPRARQHLAADNIGAEGGEGAKESRASGQPEVMWDRHTALAEAVEQAQRQRAGEVDGEDIPREPRRGVWEERQGQRCDGGGEQRPRQCAAETTREHKCDIAHGQHRCDYLVWIEPGDVRGESAPFRGTKNSYSRPRKTACVSSV